MVRTITKQFKDMISFNTVAEVLLDKYSLTTPYGKFSAIPLISAVAQTIDRDLVVVFEIKRIEVTKHGNAT